MKKLVKFDFDRQSFGRQTISRREKLRYHSVWIQETGNSCTSVFPNPCAWEQQERNNTMKQTKTHRREALSMEKSTAGTNKRSPDGLSHPNRNTIIINKIW